MTKGDKLKLVIIIGFAVMLAALMLFEYQKTPEVSISTVSEDIEDSQQEDMILIDDTTSIEEPAIVVGSSDSERDCEYQQLLEYVPLPKEEPVVQQITYRDFSNDVHLLASLIFAEIGSDWIPDIQLYYVGSVVLNRLASGYWGDTLYEVIFAPGQYEPTWSGSIYNTPTDRCYTIAQDLLDNGSVLPGNVIWQAAGPQGNGTYEVFDNPKGYDVYYCYSHYSEAIFQNGIPTNYFEG